MSVHTLNVSPLSPAQMPGQQQARPSALLRLDEVLAYTRLAKSTLYRLIKLGLFPKPVKQMSCSFWFATEIDDYLDNLKATREAA